MATIVAFVRGINVGGRRSLAMADLREIIESLGHSNVRTYIQSGNAVFDTPRLAPGMARQITDGIERRVGFAAAVMLRTKAQLEAALAGNPFAGNGNLPAKQLVFFLGEAPADAAIAALEVERFAPDQFAVIGAEMFVDFPNGQGTSKFTPDYFERRLGTVATGRNLNTIRKLIEMSR